MENPFFAQWTTPFGAPPFDLIEDSHFGPAFDRAMVEWEAEIEAIAADKNPPTFANTLEALDASGALFDKIAGVFGAINASDTNPARQAIARDLAPRKSRLDDARLQNQALWRRIHTLYEARGTAGLEPEQLALLERIHKDFERAGAALDAQRRAEIGDLNAQLAELQNSFSDSLLAEAQAFEMVLTNELDLEGLPDYVRKAAAELAEEKGHQGAWVFSLSRSSFSPFLTFSTRRDLRQKIYTAYVNQGHNGNDNDNRQVIAKIASLRVRRAELLGYATHAHWVLDDSMAQTPEAVYEFLRAMFDRAQTRAKHDRDTMQGLIEADGDSFELAPWDWWYYAERIRQTTYELDDSEIKPYFALERVRDGAFGVATKLWGLTFHARPDLPTYATGIEPFEVREADGTHLGLIYMDWPARPGKRAGAWMNAYREQHRSGGNVSPIISNNLNFPSSTDGAPVFLGADEVRTLFHEFGHGLHGLLSDTTYRRLSGTSVLRDFVEFPSQIMEKWAFHPEVLKTYAIHHETGEAMPDALIERMNKAALFNQGFRTTEYSAAALLDMDWHTLRDDDLQDADEFEAASLERMGLMKEIAPRYRSTFFSHIFSGTFYSAGYYVYDWAAVLDADGFVPFKEDGIFDPDHAKSLRENVLSRGGTENPMELYKRYRGAEPTIDALLEARGLAAE